MTESEFDCLNLLIQRPSKEALKRIWKENEELPVFVWIHGGGFGFGAGTDPMWGIFSFLDFRFQERTQN